VAALKVLEDIYGRATRLRLMRVARGLSQLRLAELASEAGGFVVTQTAVSDAERGLHSPFHLEAIAKALGVAEPRTLLDRVTL
jgi:transcriptional regulator with XRE-family HTH domain